jgi:hypothetical protein
MAKKCLLVLVLVTAAAGGVFAQNEEAPKTAAKSASVFRLGVGGGGYFTSEFGGGFDASMDVEGTKMNASRKFPYAGGGGFWFFDLIFAELSVGFFGGEGSMKHTQTGQSNEEYDSSYTGLDIGFLGKYPFVVNEKLSVFPLLGITYRAMLSVKNSALGSEIPDEKDFSALWFKFGFGLDFSLSGNIYLRTEALYGLRLANKYEDDTVDKMEARFRSQDITGNVGTLPGHGLEIKVAVGYRF